MSRFHKIEAEIWQTRNRERSLDRAFNEATKPKHQATLGSVIEGCYPYIPLGASEFLRGLALANQHLPLDRQAYGFRRSKGPKFLDVGCGPGAKLILAAAFGFEASGIEIEPRYLPQAQELGLDVQRADGRTWKGYADFDVVYLYRPQDNHVQEQKLEAQIVQYMRPGALLLAYASWGVERPGFTQIDNGGLYNGWLGKKDV